MQMDRAPYNALSFNSYAFYGFTVYVCSIFWTVFISKYQSSIYLLFAKLFNFPVSTNNPKMLAKCNIWKFKFSMRLWKNGKLWNVFWNKLVINANFARNIFNWVSEKSTHIFNNIQNSRLESRVCLECFIISLMF